MKISNCGSICGECEYFKTKCVGCYEIKGKTFWTDELPDKICPLFNCSINEKHLNNCGDCNDLPCEMFNELKDPNTSDEEHHKMLAIRVSRLRSDS